MIRPMTSDVSALSGIVANGHQAMHNVSSAPSKIPYGGFSPVQLQAGCQKHPSSPRGDFDASTVAFSSVGVLFRSRTCVRRHSRLLTPHTCPVALGSASGCSVRQPLGLLWPHPSFWSSPPVCILIPSAAGEPEVPQFTLPGFDSVPPPLLRWLPRADDESKRRAWPSPILYRFGNHFNPHTRLRVAPFTKLQR